MNPTRSLAQAWPDGPPARRAPAAEVASTLGVGRPSAPRPTAALLAGGS